MGVVAIGTIASASAGGSNSTLSVTGVNLTGQKAVVVFVGYNEGNGNVRNVNSVIIDPGGPNQTPMGAPLAVVRTGQFSALARSELEGLCPLFTVGSCDGVVRRLARRRCGDAWIGGRSQAVAIAHRCAASHAEVCRRRVPATFLVAGWRSGRAADRGGPGRKAAARP